MAERLTLASLYADIRFVHVCCVVLSGTLFTVRGLLRVSGSAVASIAPLRFMSYTIDTALLAAAILLTLILQQYPFVNTWLTVKVLLLAVYIVLGSFALKRAHTLRGRWIPRIAPPTG